MKRITPLAGAVCIFLGLLTAYAGKPERDKQDELAPKVTEARKAADASCGTAIAVEVDWASYKKADDMMRIPNCLEAITEALKDFCAKPADKDALKKNLSKISIAYNGDQADAPKYDDKTKTITMYSTDSSYMSGDQLRRIMDQW